MARKCSVQHTAVQWAMCSAVGNTNTAQQCKVLSKHDKCYNLRSPQAPRANKTGKEEEEEYNKLTLSFLKKIMN